ncbi:MAG: hypothetical protein WC775_04455 [Patescibacteria group bacterium]|jgi:hypothetical protein
MSQETVHLWVAGADGNGGAMTALRLAFGEKGYVTSSLLPTSLRSVQDAFPLRPGERSKEQHYHNTATAIQEKLGSQNHIVIELHSGGLWEFIQMAPHIDTSFWQGKEIDVVILGGAGIAEKGLRSFFKRLGNVAESMKYGEQHSVFPIDSEHYYETMQKEYPNTYGDTKESRADRRARFLKVFQTLEPDVRHRQKILNRIAEIDNRMHYVSREEIDVYIDQRAHILAPYITKMFHGDHIPAQTHQRVMQEYGEVMGTREKLKILAPSVIAGLSLLATSLQQTRRGIDTYLLQILSRIEDSGAEVRLHAVVPEFDAMVSPRDIDFTGPPQIASNGLPLNSVFVARNFSHGSWGINEDAIRNALRNLFG